MAVSGVVVFFTIHLLIAVLMVVIGTLYHIDNLQYSGLTRDDINAVPSLTLAAGVLMIIIMIGSCVIRKMYNKEGYILMSLLLLMIQLGASVHGCIKVNDSTGSLNNTLQADMTESIAEFYKHNNTGYIYYLNQVQEKLHCCGVNSPNDYNITQMPISCCPKIITHDKNITFCKNTEKHYTDGCALLVYNELSHNDGIVAYVTVVLSIVQLFGTLFITLNLIGMDRALVQATNYEHF